MLWGECHVRNKMNAPQQGPAFMYQLELYHHMTMSMSDHLLIPRKYLPVVTSFSFLFTRPLQLVKYDMLHIKHSPKAIVNIYTSLLQSVQLIKSQPPHPRNSQMMMLLQLHPAIDPSPKWLLKIQLS